MEHSFVAKATQLLKLFKLKTLKHLSKTTKTIQRSRGKPKSLGLFIRGGSSRARVKQRTQYLLESLPVCVGGWLAVDGDDCARVGWCVGVRWVPLPCADLRHLRRGCSPRRAAPNTAAAGVATKNPILLGMGWGS